MGNYGYAGAGAGAAAAASGGAHRPYSMHAQGTGESHRRDMRHRAFSAPNSWGSSNVSEYHHQDVRYTTNPHTTAALVYPPQVQAAGQSYLSQTSSVGVSGYYATGDAGALQQYFTANDVSTMVMPVYSHSQQSAQFSIAHAHAHATAIGPPPGLSNVPNYHRVGGQQFSPVPVGSHSPSVAQPGPASPGQFVTTAAGLQFMSSVPSYVVNPVVVVQVPEAAGAAGGRYSSFEGQSTQQTASALSGAQSASSSSSASSSLPQPPSQQQQQQQQTPSGATQAPPRSPY